MSCVQPCSPHVLPMLTVCPLQSSPPPSLSLPYPFPMRATVPSLGVPCAHSALSSAPRSESSPFSRASPRRRYRSAQRRPAARASGAARRPRRPPSLSPAPPPLSAAGGLQRSQRSTVNPGRSDAAEPSADSSGNRGSNEAAHGPARARPAALHRRLPTHVRSRPPGHTARAAEIPTQHSQSASVRRRGTTSRSAEKPRIQHVLPQRSTPRPASASASTPQPLSPIRPDSKHAQLMSSKKILI